MPKESILKGVPRHQERSSVKLLFRLLGSLYSSSSQLGAARRSQSQQCLAVVALETPSGRDLSGFRMLEAYDTAEGLAIPKRGYATGTILRLALDWMTMFSAGRPKHFELC